MADSVNGPEIFTLREHQFFSEEQKNKFQELKIEFSQFDGFSVPKYFAQSTFKKKSTKIIFLKV